MADGQARLRSLTRLPRASADHKRKHDQHEAKQSERQILPHAGLFTLRGR